MKGSHFIRNIWIRTGLISASFILFAFLWKGNWISQKVTGLFKNEKKTSEVVPPVEKPKLEFYNGLSGKLFKGASGIILAELNRVKWNTVFESYDPDFPPYHELYFVKEMPLDNGFSRVLIAVTFTNISGNHCHFCMGMNSIFEFGLKEGKWILRRKGIAFPGGDEFGEHPGELKVVNLGPPRQFGIIMECSFGSMGFDHSEKYVYTFVNGKMREVFSFMSFNSNRFGALNADDIYDYSTTMKLVKGKGKFFDIVLKSEGEFGDNESDNGKRFVFNGSKYVVKK